MNFDKINELNQELAEFPTITEKLNHWKNNYYDKGDVWLRKYFEFKTKEEKGTDFHDRLSGELMLPIDGNKLILELHSPTNAIPQEKRIEYYRWMLFFLAGEMFDYRIKPALVSQLESPLGKEILTGRLNKIKAIQNEAKNALENGSIVIRLVNNPTKEQLYLWYADDLYSRVEIPIHNMENSHVRSVCEHKYEYPFLIKLLKENEKEKKDKKILTIVGIDIPRLVSTLKVKRYIVDNDEKRMINWFKGIPINEPIQIIKPMSHFASLVADLQESGYIKNNKTFCRDHIHKTLLFENEQKSSASIKNALNKNAYSRLQKADTNNFIDIKDFTQKT